MDNGTYTSLWFALEFCSHDYLDCLNRKMILLWIWESEREEFGDGSLNGGENCLLGRGFVYGTSTSRESIPLEMKHERCEDLVW